MNEPTTNRSQSDLIRRSDIERALECSGVTKGFAIRRMIASIPAVDAEEARHGYWLKTLDGNVCSDCGSIERVCRRFCPQCGCDMRTGL